MHRILIFPTQNSTWKSYKINYKQEKDAENTKNVPLLASSEDAKPVEVIRRDKNCPNPRPITVFFVQNSLKLLIIFSFSTPKQD